MGGSGALRRQRHDLGHLAGDARAVRFLAEGLGHKAPRVLDPGSSEAQPAAAPAGRGDGEDGEALEDAGWPRRLRAAESGSGRQEAEPRRSRRDTAVREERSS